MELLEAIFTALVAQGPVGILAAVGLFGWVMTGWLVKRQYGKKDEVTKAKDSHAREMKKMQEEHAKQIRELHDAHHDQLTTLHDEYHKEMKILTEKHHSLMMDLAEKRVDDVKELTDDYNDLATNTLQTLDRLIYQLEVRRSGSNSKTTEGTSK
jgi:hypothetical protein